MLKHTHRLILEKVCVSSHTFSRVTHLTFGYYFNQSILEKCIPNFVTHLTFGHIFNQPILEKCIPNYVTYLTFGVYYNQPILEKCIPNSVTHLTLDRTFYKSIIKYIPKTISILFLN